MKDKADPEGVRHATSTQARPVQMNDKADPKGATSTINTSQFNKMD